MKRFCIFATFMLTFFAFTPLFAAFNSTTVNGDIIVTDTETDLVWQKTYVSGKTWQQALSYCEELTYAGYSDWRLPNKNELSSLINYAKSNPASDFPDMPSEDFWSSTTYVMEYHPYDAWYVGFYKGNVEYHTMIYDYYVRCVRGGNNTANKEISHIKNEASPTKTLSWSQKAPNYMVWGDAIDYCKKLKEGGHNDWHLPTISELRTLIQNYPPTETGGKCKVTDSCLSNSCGNDACAVRDWDPTGKRNKLGDPDWFWSSSIQSDNPQEAWLVGFNGGFVGADFFDNEHAVRCVR